MKKLLILLLASAAIVAIGYFCVYKMHAPTIQADIAKRAKEALATNGIDWAEVEVDGRDITVTGEAPNSELKQSALQLAGVDGYNYIDDQLSVFGMAETGNESDTDADIATGEDETSAAGGAEESGAEPDANAEAAGDETPNPQEAAVSDRGDMEYSLMLMKTDEGKIRLEGAVDPVLHKALLAEAQERYGKDNVEDKLHDLQESRQPEDMQKASSLVLEKLNGLQSGTVILAGERVIVEGASQSQKMLDEVQKQISEELPDGFNPEFNLVMAGSGGADQQEAGAAGQVASNIGETGRQQTGEQPAQIGAKECQAKFNKALKNYIRFKRSSSAVEKTSHSTLNNLATIAHQCGNYNIVVHGYTDSSGRNDYNKRLSKKRAQTVVNYLVKKGIPDAKLRAVGHGSSNPIASNKTEKGRARNRRIELTIEKRK